MGVCGWVGVCVRVRECFSVNTDTHIDAPGEISPKRLFLSFSQYEHEDQQGCDSCTDLYPAERLA